jgi:hypothetical protein
MTRANRASDLWKWVIFLAVPTGLLLSAVMVFGGGWGLASKSLWDWMELLVIPVALALGAWWLKREERRSQQRAALETERRNLLATYFDRMQELLLERGLKDASGREEVVEIARARTLHALRNLDGERKGHLVRFLVDSGALARQTKDGSYHSVVRLSYADLSNADLGNVHLEGVNLWCANFENANLKNAHLVGTNLPYAFMKGAILDHADLSGAYLKEAVVEPDQLRGARDLEGATMPDGTSHEDWLSSGKPDWTLRGMPQTWTSHESR